MRLPKAVLTAVRRADVGRLAVVAIVVGVLLGSPAPLLVGVAIADTPQTSAYFAEPVSGRRVTEYAIELPVDRMQRRTFNIPQDCDAVMRSLGDGAIYKGTIVDRRLWQKVEADCRYDNFLNRHPLQVIEDYVSDYDFMNARLADLPIDRRCVVDLAGGEPEQRGPAATDGFGVLLHFPLAEPFNPAVNPAAQGECALRDGLFYGRIYVTPEGEGIRCDPGAPAPSLRLIAVDFADVNGDRILDAVLRFVPIGPGAARLPLILPLTRMQADGPFQVPEPAATVPGPPGLP